MDARPLNRTALLVILLAVGLVSAASLHAAPPCPVPQRFQAQPGTFSLKGPLCLRLPVRGDPRVEQGVASLTAILKEAADTDMAVRRDLPATYELLLDHGGKVPLRAGAAPTKKEGYSLSIEPQGVCIRGADAAGLYYGMQTLRQLLLGVRGDLPCATVEDWPDIALRGYAPFSGKPQPEKHPDNLACYQRIGELAAQYKLNCLSFECESLADDELRRLAEFCRLRFIEPIPYHPFLCKNRNGVARYAEASDAELAAMLAPAETAIRLVRPRVFGIGGDELVSDYDHLSRRSIYPDAQRKRRPPHEWLALALERLHGYLKPRGVATAIWADCLIDEDAFCGRAAMIHGYGGRPDYHCRAAALLPKDIVLWDWHYEPACVYPTLDYLQKLGFSVVGCPWRAVGNPELFAKHGKQTATEHFVGMLNTEWVAPRWIPDHGPLIARAGDAFWSVGRFRQFGPEVAAIERLARENPLLNLPEGRRKVAVASEVIAGQSLGFLVQSAGVKSALFLPDGLGAKGRRTVDGDYLLNAAPGCSFQEIRLIPTVNPAFEGSLWISFTSAGEDFVKIKTLAGKERHNLDLTSRVRGRPLFRVRFRGYNPGKGSAVFLRRIEVESRVGKTSGR